jgi:hypothetical protein
MYIYFTNATHIGDAHNSGKRGVSMTMGGLCSADA